MFGESKYTSDWLWLFFFFFALDKNPSYEGFVNPSKTTGFKAPASSSTSHLFVSLCHFSSSPPSPPCDFISLCLSSLHLFYSSDVWWLTKMNFCHSIFRKPRLCSPSKFKLEWVYFLFIMLIFCIILLGFDLGFSRVFDLGFSRVLGCGLVAFAYFVYANFQIQVWQVCYFGVWEKIMLLLFLLFLRERDMPVEKLLGRGSGRFYQVDK